MPRFARLFEAAADTLHAYYQAIAEKNLDGAMDLWIDEELVSWICASGEHRHGLDQIRQELEAQFRRAHLVIDPVDIRVYDSLGTVVYAIAEAHRGEAPNPRMVFSTYVMVHERGAWRIAHIHASPMPDEAAGEFTARMRYGHGSLH
jgi:uncharacterized protein (TIGR02246 family)